MPAQVRIQLPVREAGPGAVRPVHGQRRFADPRRAGDRGDAAGQQTVQKRQFRRPAREAARFGGQLLRNPPRWKGFRGSRRVAQRRRVRRPQFGPRVDSEFVHEPRPHLPVEPERLAPLPERVAGSDQKSLRCFVERLFRSGFDDAGQDLRGGPGFDHCLGIPAKRFPALGEQRNDLRVAGERRQVGQRSAAPQPERLAERRHDAGGIGVAVRVVRLSQKFAEPPQVDVDRVLPHRVTPADVRQHPAARPRRAPGFQQPPQMLDMGLDHVHRTWRRPVAPQRVHEVPPRDGVPSGEREQPEDRAPAGRAEFEFGAVVPRAQRSQYLDANRSRRHRGPPLSAADQRNGPVCQSTRKWLRTG